MAKRMKSKIQPAELKIALQMRAAGYHYVDLSQCASIINRRFYRQGLNWAVSHFTFYKTTPTETGADGVSVSKLPNTWVMSNAWEKSFRAWQRMNKEALAENESVKPKFLDFKVFMNSAHHTAGSAANLRPVDQAANLATAGEWVYSKVVVPETTTGTGAVTEYELIAIGANNPGVGASGLNAKSLIEGYAASRGLPNVLDPNTPDDANVYSQNWMMAMFNDGTLQDNVVIEDMITENNQAPYPYEGDGTATDTQYPGGANQLPAARVVGAAYFNAGTNANKVVIEGDNFPCGLVELYSTTDDTISVIVHLVPGPHRGYLAESMTEM